MSAKPLSGVRIVDFTHVWAGPLCTRLLGDLGADVVKVEAPLGRGGRGPMPKGVGIFMEGDPGDEPWNRQAIFNKLNRSKRGVCLDVKEADGHKTLLALISKADVVIENFSAFAMQRMGLGFDVMQRVNEKLLYVAMPGFGSTGPYASFAAFGPSVEPMTGLGVLLGYGPDEPRNTAMALPDAIAGITAAGAVVSGLRTVRETGRGLHTEVTLIESAINFWGDFIADHQLGRTHRPMANRHPFFSPHGVYPTAGEDQWIAIACPTDEAFESLRRFFDWPAEPRFVDNDSRRDHEDQLDTMIAVATIEHDKHALAERLQSVGVIAGAVNATPDVIDDAHLNASGYWADLGLDGQTALRYPGLAMRINDQAPVYERPAPRLGEHNAEVLGDWLGKTDAEIDRLLGSGAFATQPPA